MNLDKTIKLEFVIGNKLYNIHKISAEFCVESKIRRCLCKKTAKWHDGLLKNNVWCDTCVQEVILSSLFLADCVRETKE